MRIKIRSKKAKPEKQIYPTNLRAIRCLSALLTRLDNQLFIEPVEKTFFGLFETECKVRIRFLRLALSGKDYLNPPNKDNIIDNADKFDFVWQRVLN